jgi:hypothetical protein
MNLLLLENRLCIVTAPTHVAGYDLDFELHFHCTHPHLLDQEMDAVLRIGAIADYAREYEENLSAGLRLVNSPAQHELASELALWYPLLSDLTPRTICRDEFPSADEVEAEFGWPVFLKGSRQTSKHSPYLAIIRDREHYARAMEAWRKDSILHWQKVAIREFIPLRPVKGEVAGKVNTSTEFRTFWWHGQCVGAGQYWSQVPAYQANDLDTGIALAGEAAARLRVPFLVVDVAKTADGHWIVIECNDAQESGYTAVPPNLLWRNIVDALLL